MPDITERPWMDRGRIAVPVVHFQAPPPILAQHEATQAACIGGALAPWTGLVSPETHACPNCQVQAVPDEHGALAVQHAFHRASRRSA